MVHSDVEIENKKEIEVKTVPSCASCGINAFPNDNSDPRYHFKTDLHKFNIKRRVYGLSPVDEQEFRQLIKSKETATAEDSDSDSLSGEDDETDEIEEDDISTRGGEQLTAILEHELQDLMINDNQTGPVSHLNTQSPLIFMHSAELSGPRIFGAYKVLFNACLLYTSRCV